MGTKARKVTNTLVGIMPNIGGPNQSWCKVLSNVVYSILLMNPDLFNNHSSDIVHAVDNHYIL